MNDRHVVMNRSHADVWMGRWALFCSDALLTTLPLQSLAHELGPRGIHVAHVVVDGLVDAPDTVGKFFPALFEALYLPTKLLL